MKEEKAMASEETTYQENSRKKLERAIEAAQKKALGEVLDFVEVALGVGNSEKFQSIRSKILRSLNNAVRSIHRELELHYAVDYEFKTEDIIQVNPKK